MKQNKETKRRQYQTKSGLKQAEHTFMPRLGRRRYTKNFNYEPFLTTKMTFNKTFNARRIPLFGTVKTLSEFLV